MPVTSLLSPAAPDHILDEILKRANVSPKGRLKAHNIKKTPPPGDGQPGGIFNGIPTSPTLHFTPCLDVNLDFIPYANTFQCARLEVPLDYSKKSSVAPFEVAVLKLPAISASPTKKAFVLFQDFEGNVDFSLQLAPFYQLGFPDFDFYAFDTRGSGYTTPQLQCFANTDAQFAYAYQSVNPDKVFGSFNGTFLPTEENIKTNIKRSNDFMSQFGSSCRQYYGAYLPYMSSADHARDLHNIISQLDNGTFINILSYGYTTVLTQTYAAMYPNEFDAIVLDGTVNAKKVWDGGDNDYTAIQDANKAVQTYFDSCAASTPCTLDNLAVSDLANFPVGNCGGCYFWNSTADAVEARYEALKAKYYNTPFRSSVPSPICGACEADWTLISHSLGIDQPADGLQFGMMSSLRLLEWDMGVALPGGAIEWFAQNFPATTAFYPIDLVQTCMDQGGSSINGVANQEAYMKAMNASYNGLGLFGTARREMWCANFGNQVKPNDPFTGFKGASPKIATRGSILFKANTADGRAALANAQEMSSIFTHSRVLTVNQFGTTSFFSDNSQACVSDYLAQFGVDGTLPPAGAFCDDVVGGAFGVPYQKDYRGQ